MRAAVALALSPSKSVAHTMAPRAARASAMPLPMPLPAPVTKAACPANSDIRRPHSQSIGALDQAKASGRFCDDAEDVAEGSSMQLRMSTFAVSQPSCRHRWKYDRKSVVEGKSV